MKVSIGCSDTSNLNNRFYRRSNPAYSSGLNGTDSTLGVRARVEPWIAYLGSKGEGSHETVGDCLFPYVCLRFWAGGFADQRNSDGPVRSCRTRSRNQVNSIGNRSRPDYDFRRNGELCRSE